VAGQTIKYTTTGAASSVDLRTLLTNQSSVPHFAITVRADPNNSSNEAVYVGRKAPVIPLYADDSQTFSPASLEELMFSDGGVANLIVYFDLSGPMDPRAFHVTIHSPNEPL
jgi:hypothetical protein